MNWQQQVSALWNPPPKLLVSEWADANRKLSSEASAEPGQWRTDRAPYQREIMDTCNDPDVEIITWMSSSQVGKTEVILNIIGYFVENDPSPLLCLQPTQKPMAEAFSKDRVSTMFRDSPSLTPLLETKGRHSENTILHKSFPGGHLTIGGANSPASLASRPIRIVLSDEIDRYPESAGTEGDPLSLAERRTVTFWNKKKIRTSTPTIDGASRIDQSFKEGDQRHYYVPCPHCDHEQRLVWSNVEWDKHDDGEPDFETVRIVCEGCDGRIYETSKQLMLRRGRWIADKPFNGHASFHINALYSPWISWAEIVEEFYQAKGDYERMKVWTNTLMGETFKEEAVELVPEHFLSRVEDYGDKVPNGVLVITGGVDVQEDRLELGVIGWGHGEESWWIERMIFYGDTSQPGVWEDLAQVLINQQYETEDGRRIRINATGVDTGFRADTVYDFVRAHQQKIRVYGLKGMGGDRPIWTPPSYGQRAPIPLYMVGTDAAKDLLFARFQSHDGGGVCHWPQTCDLAFFEQMTAEKSQKKMRRGFEIREWVKIRTRNEILDLYVYNLVTLYTLNPRWEVLDPSFEKPEPPEPPKPEQPGPTEQLVKQRRRGARRQTKGFVNRWR